MLYAWNIEVLGLEVVQYWAKVSKQLVRYRKSIKVINIKKE